MGGTTMRMKAIGSVLFLVFISILSLKTNVTNVGKLNTGPFKAMGHSVTVNVAVARVL